MNNLALKYFESRSQDYKHRQQSWPWSLVRARELNSIESEIEGYCVKSNNCLELGSGSGSLTKILCKYFDELEVVDFSQTMLNSIDLNVTKHCSTVEDFCSPHKFDLIISFGLLEFVSNLGEVLLKYLDLLSSSGVMLIISPIDDLNGRIYQSFHSLPNENIKLISLKKVSTLVSKHDKVVSVTCIPPFNKIIKIL